MPRACVVVRMLDDARLIYSCIVHLTTPADVLRRRGVASTLSVDNPYAGATIALRFASQSVKRSLSVYNPYTGATVCEVPLLSKQEALLLVDQAAATQDDWTNGVNLDDRIAVCQQVVASCYIYDFPSHHANPTAVSGGLRGKQRCDRAWGFRTDG